MQETTSEMVTFYERRTRAHIERVRRNLALLASEWACGEELLARGEVHDASKFEDAERVPYIWLTEYHRCRWRNIPFTYPEGMEARTQAAVRHHVSHNRHHPEFHADPNEMTDVDLIEMVCDWTAMSEEFGQDGGSARGWAMKTIGERVAFNDEKTRFVFEVIEQLDRLRSCHGAGDLK
ncbi:DUF5662 family protein [Gimesia chilikensis]|nr:DUF5662 family protein [Gimesia chilikensis]